MVVFLSYQALVAAVINERKHIEFLSAKGERTYQPVESDRTVLVNTL